MCSNQSFFSKACLIFLSKIFTIIILFLFSNLCVAQIVQEKLISAIESRNIEELKKAHEIRNRIVQEDDFTLTEKEVEDVMSYYENFLRYFQVLD